MVFVKNTKWAWFGLATIVLSSLITLLVPPAKAFAVPENCTFVDANTINCPDGTSTGNYVFAPSNTPPGFYHDDIDDDEVSTACRDYIAGFGEIDANGQVSAIFHVVQADDRVCGAKIDTPASPPIIITNATVAVDTIGAISNPDPDGEAENTPSCETEGGTMAGLPAH